MYYRRSLLGQAAGTATAAGGFWLRYEWFVKRPGDPHVKWRMNNMNIQSVTLIFIYNYSGLPWWSWWRGGGGGVVPVSDPKMNLGAGDPLLPFSFAHRFPFYFHFLSVSLVHLFCLLLLFLFPFFIHHFPFTIILFASCLFIFFSQLLFPFSFSLFSRFSSTIILYGSQMSKNSHLSCLLFIYYFFPVHEVFMYRLVFLFH